VLNDLSGIALLVRQLYAIDSQVGEKAEMLLSTGVTSRELFRSAGTVIDDNSHWNRSILTSVVVDQEETAARKSDARCHKVGSPLAKTQMACRPANQRLISPNETPVATYTRATATEEPWQMAVNRVNDRLRVPVTDKRRINAVLVYQAFRSSFRTSAKYASLV